MTPVVFINSRSCPFVDLIAAGTKIYETRNRDVLRKLFERRRPFYIAETGHGKPMVKCSARIRSIVTVYTEEAWNSYRKFHAVPVGSAYDWQPDTKKKVMYELSDVVPVVPFCPPEGKRHGRVWMEYNEEV